MMDRIVKKKKLVRLKSEAVDFDSRLGNTLGDEKLCDIVALISLKLDYLSKLLMIYKIAVASKLLR